MINLATSLGIKVIHKALTARDSYIYEAQHPGLAAFKVRQIRSLSCLGPWRKNLVCDAISQSAEQHQEGVDSEDRQRAAPDQNTARPLSGGHLNTR